MATVDLQLQADRTGEFTLTLEANADNDADPGNNSETVRLTVGENVDVRFDPLPDEVRIKLGRTIRYPITVRSATHPVTNVEVRLNRFASNGYRFQAVTTAQGSCSFLDWSITCALGTMAANSAVLIELDLVGETPEAGELSAMVVGDQDIDSENGLATGIVIVEPRGSVAVSTSLPLTRPIVGASFDHPRITVFAPTNTDAVLLRISVPTEFTIETAIPDTGQCVVNVSIVDCTFGDLTAGEQRIVDLRLRANQAGSFTTQVEVLTDDDSDPSDNSASITIDVDPAPAPPPPAPSGGGGGSLDWLSLTLGALGLGVRRRRRIARSA
jgi:hypothetical protein